MYLPLGYVHRFSELTDLYCSEERCNCEPDVLIDMISDLNWGKDTYTGPNKEKYFYTYNEFQRNYLEMHIVSSSFAAAGFTGVWKYNKVVYEPDYDFSKALMGTDRLRVYSKMIKHLPFNTFYLDFSKNGLFEYEGFFVQVKVYDTGAIRISSLPTEKGYSHIPVNGYEQPPTVFADVFWITPEMLSFDQGMEYFDYDLHMDFMLTSDSFKTQWFIGGVSNYRLFILQFLMYLSSDEPDIIENQDTKRIYKPAASLKNNYREIRKWDVGCRYGETIRSHKYKKIQQDSVDDRGTQSTKRPHIRKAHWKTYHIGKGRTETIVKWIAAGFVNGDSDDIIVNIHAVTDEDPKCSKGEEAVKEYLRSKNISYTPQKYVREIRKRYDFPRECKGKLIFIEFDGGQHFKPVNRWKGKKGYQERRQADIEKNEYCLQNGIPLLRIRFDQAHMIPVMVDDLMENMEKYYRQVNTYLTNEEYYSICE